MTHKRSKEKQQLRKIRSTILLNSFRDRRKGEIICRTSRIEILAMMTEPIQVSLIDDLEKGEVLIDPRGNGTLQKINIRRNTYNETEPQKTRLTIQRSSQTDKPKPTTRI